jgi:hypothetical protein
MVDLFAVLAIVFMLHSNEEITVAQAENDEKSSPRSRLTRIHILRAPSGSLTRRMFLASFSARPS